MGNSGQGSVCQESGGSFNNMLCGGE